MIKSWQIAAKYARHCEYSCPTLLEPPGPSQPSVPMPNTYCFPTPEMPTIERTLGTDDPASKCPERDRDLAQGTAGWGDVSLGLPSPPHLSLQLPKCSGGCLGGWGMATAPLHLPSSVALRAPGSHSWLDPERVERELQPGHSFPAEPRTELNELQALLLCPWVGCLSTHAQPVLPGVPQRLPNAKCSTHCPLSSPQWASRFLGPDRLRKQGPW